LGLLDGFVILGLLDGFVTAVMPAKQSVCESRNAITFGMEYTDVNY